MDCYKQYAETDANFEEMMRDFDAQFEHKRIEAIRARRLVFALTIRPALTETGTTTLWWLEHYVAMHGYGIVSVSPTEMRVSFVPLASKFLQKPGLPVPAPSPTLPRDPLAYPLAGTGKRDVLMEPFGGAETNAPASTSSPAAKRVRVDETDSDSQTND